MRRKKERERGIWEWEERKRERERGIWEWEERKKEREEKDKGNKKLRKTFCHIKKI